MDTKEIRPNKKLKKAAANCGYYLPKPYPVLPVKNQKVRKEIENLLKQYCHDSK